MSGAIVLNKVAVEESPSSRPALTLTAGGVVVSQLHVGSSLDAATGRMGAMSSRRMGKATAVTKANPGVVTCANHGLMTGAKVVFSSVSGMTELNSGVYTVTAATADTFDIGVDSSAYGTFSGAATWTALADEAQAKALEVVIVEAAGASWLTLAAHNLGGSIARILMTPGALDVYEAGARFAAGGPDVYALSAALPAQRIKLSPSVRKLHFVAVTTVGAVATPLTVYPDVMLEMEAAA